MKMGITKVKTKTRKILSYLSRIKKLGFVIFNLPSRCAIFLRLVPLLVDIDTDVKVYLADYYSVNP